MNRDVLFSSASDEWETPQDLFDRLDAEFNFQIDLAASATNAKCALYYCEKNDAPKQDWIHDGQRGWCNPPYSRGLCAKFIAKAAAQRLKGFLTVMLLPARTDTKAFHEHIYDASTWKGRTGIEIRLLPGRLKFSGAKAGAPFPSMLIVFKP